jgi:uncharacterized protein (TIGR02271 family)
MKSGFAWFDMMLNFQREMQRASLQSLSSYSPTAGATITGRLPRENFAATGGFTAAGSTERVVPVGEERLNVATRLITGETTRIRRRVVEQPVEQQVTLREEKVIVERRPSTGKPQDTNLFTETVVEMSDSREVPTVWKSLHVAEEVVLRKQVTERTEKVRDTVRRDVVEVDHGKEQPQQAEFVSKVAAFQEKAAETREQLASLRHAAQGEDRKDAPRQAASDEASRTTAQLEGPKADGQADQKPEDAAQQARRKS